MTDENLVDLNKKKEERRQQEDEEHDEYCPICNHNDSITLYNMIGDACTEALNNSSLYIDDILSVVERVKLDLLREHIENRIETRLKKSGVDLKEYDDSE